MKSHDVDRIEGVSTESTEFLGLSVERCCRRSTLCLFIVRKQLMLGVERRHLCIKIGVSLLLFAFSSFFAPAN